MRPLLLRVSETAALLNVSRWTVYRWIEEGRLKATKIGKSSLRVFHESAMTLIEENQKDEDGCPTKPRATVRPSISACIR